MQGIILGTGNRMVGGKKMHDSLPAYNLISSEKRQTTVCILCKLPTMLSAMEKIKHVVQGGIAVFERVVREEFSSLAVQEK